MDIHGKFEKTKITVAWLNNDSLYLKIEEQGVKKSARRILNTPLFQNFASLNQDNFAWFLHLQCKRQKRKKTNFHFQGFVTTFRF